MQRGSPLLATATQALPPWHKRPLLHFVGHVPKVYISAVRMLLWTQVYQETDVTARSHTLRCNLGPYSICSHPERLNSEFKTFCAPWCPGLGTPSKPCRRRNANLLKKTCETFKEVGINATKHLSALDRATDRKRLPYESWVQEAARHRFCVVARGDWPGTPKLADFVLLGAAGGCIPLVFVSFTKRPTLPFGRYFDWCKAAVLVSEKVITAHKVGALLHQLRNMSAAEANAKMLALDQIRDALYWRPSPSRPSAADYVLAEACELAHQRGNRTRMAESRQLGLRYTRCMIH